MASSAKTVDAALFKGLSCCFKLEITIKTPVGKKTFKYEKCVEGSAGNDDGFMKVMASSEIEEPAEIGPIGLAAPVPVGGAKGGLFSCCYKLEITVKTPAGTKTYKFGNCGK
ncbi:hypothetical protein FH972_006666 [Carpinus fangiana]|uniref:Uncharacterized protein n=1 Tax=Carpinus fangiana TaxID=176857 RepID=A0A5N6QWH8_9ROSI|nr:hypothetical protein FH972_006666 [Carpinus fangiana]